MLDEILVRGVDCGGGPSSARSRGAGVLAAFAVDPGGCRAAGPDRAAGRRRDRHQRDRWSGGLFQADRDQLEAALPRRRRGPPTRQTRSVSVAAVLRQGGPPGSAPVTTV